MAFWPLTIETSRLGMWAVRTKRPERRRTLTHLGLTIDIYLTIPWTAGGVELTAILIESRNPINMKQAASIQCPMRVMLLSRRA